MGRQGMPRGLAWATANPRLLGPLGLAEGIAAMKLLVGLGNPGPEYARTRHNLGFLLTELIARQSAGLDPLALAGSGPEVAALFHPAKTFSVFPPSPGPAAWALSSLLANAPSAGLSGFSWRRLSDPDLLLVRPERFMNRSGEPLAGLLRALGWLPGQLPNPAGQAPLGLPAGSAAGTSSPSESPTAAPRDLPLLVAYDDLDLPPHSLRLRAFGGHGGHNGMRSILSSLGTDRFPRLRIGIGRGGTDAARHVLEEFTPAEWSEVLTSLQEGAEAVLAWAGGLAFDQCMTRFHSRWTQGR
jgi:peptidyl-tRNA hydrolase